MRKVVLFMHLSLDGFAATPDGGLDWIVFSDDLMDYADEIVATTGSPMYGRTTYGMMEGFWPTVLDDPKAAGHDLQHARWVQDVHKIVFSTTLPSADWNNTELIKGDVASNIERLKKEPGKDLVIFGSPGLAKSLLEFDLIDEYRLTINPVILGKGVAVFNELQQKVSLKLLSSKTTKAGVLTLHYEAVR
jgi:dihydrofolate reductase